jgi:hypothetical protein
MVAALGWYLTMHEDQDALERCDEALRLPATDDVDPLCAQALCVKAGSLSPSRAAGPIPVRSLVEQEALQRPGHVAAVLDRPHPLTVHSAGPDEQILNERRLAPTVRSPITRPVAASIAPTVCDCLWVSAPITIIRTVPSLGSLTNGIAGGHISVGARPRLYQVTPGSSGGGGRHNIRRSDRWSTESQWSARRRSEDLPAAPDAHRPTPRLSH